MRRTLSLVVLLAMIRKKVEAMRADTTTPDTRLADDPLPYNPASAGNLVRLMLGGLHHGNRTLVLNARVRYFDPDFRSIGLFKLKGFSGVREVFQILPATPVAQEQ
jgi:hypothetical protein